MWVRLCVARQGQDVYSQPGTPASWANPDPWPVLSSPCWSGQPPRWLQTAAGQRCQGGPGWRPWEPGLRSRDRGHAGGEGQRRPQPQGQETATSGGAFLPEVEESFSRGGSGCGCLKRTVFLRHLPRAGARLRREDGEAPALCPGEFARPCCSQLGPGLGEEQVPTGPQGVPGRLTGDR